MKLLEMKCVSDLVRGDVALEPENQEISHMVKLETAFEVGMYDEMYNGNDYDVSLFNVCMEQDISKLDDDITYYFMLDEQEPKVGETFELDDIKWERVA